MFKKKQYTNKECVKKFNEDLDECPGRDDPYDGYGPDWRVKAEKRKDVNSGVRGTKINF